MPVFSPEVVARAFGDRAADASTMVDLDEHGGHWLYTVDDEQRELKVPWTTAISERPEIRGHRLPR